MSEDSDGPEKTEDPTQKRLDDALERGDVAKSQEVNTWFMIAGAALVALVAVRATLEERVLRAELEGYDAYARRVRYRLIPYIW